MSCASGLVLSEAGTNLIGVRSNASRACTWARNSGLTADEKLRGRFAETEGLDSLVLRFFIIMAIFFEQSGIGRDSTANRWTYKESNISSTKAEGHPLPLPASNIKQVQRR